MHGLQFGWLVLPRFFVDFIHTRTRTMAYPFFLEHEQSSLIAMCRLVTYYLFSSPATTLIPSINSRATGHIYFLPAGK